MFQRQVPDYENADWTSLLAEARSQAVFPLVFPVVGPMLPPDISSRARAVYYAHIQAGARNARSHGELHELLTAGHIPYVILKGMASAACYPDPFLRTMGDIDFLVGKGRLDEAKELLIREGFTAGAEGKHHAHLAFRRGEAVFEMHWEPNGLPDGEKGDICRGFLSDIFETAVLYETQSERFLIPDDFHHGLILLLHTAKHMINTGIGLRHLCDWAVFAGRLDEQTFRGIFENRLRTAGLWRFAQILTQLSAEYLGCPPRAWAADEADRDLLESLMEDVFASGNFGRKDAERINEAKLITSGGAGGMADRSGSALLSAFSEKAYKALPLCRKVRFLLPIGWLIAGVKHLRMIARGKRPKFRIGRTVSGAKARRKIYREFRLFQ